MLRFGEKCLCHIQTQVFNPLVEGNVQGQIWNDLRSLIVKIIHI